MFWNQWVFEIWVKSCFHSEFIQPSESVWIRARFPKTREWSSDWTKVGMSEQEVSFGFCLSHCDTIANICSWVHSESWTACLDANKIQQVHSNKVNKKRNELYRDFWMCVVVMFSSRAGTCPSMLWKPWGASTTKASEVAYGLMASKFASMAFLKGSAHHTGGIFKKSIKLSWLNDGSNKKLNGWFLDLHCASKLTELSKGHYCPEYSIPAC